MGKHAIDQTVFSRVPKDKSDLLPKGNRKFLVFFYARGKSLSTAFGTFELYKRLRYGVTMDQGDHTTGTSL